MFAVSYLATAVVEGEQFTPGGVFAGVGEFPPTPKGKERRGGMGVLPELKYKREATLRCVFLSLSLSFVHTHMHAHTHTHTHTRAHTHTHTHTHTHAQHTHTHCDTHTHTVSLPPQTKVLNEM